MTASKYAHLVRLPTRPDGITPGMAYRCMDVARRGATAANRPLIDRLHADGLIARIPARPKPHQLWHLQLTPAGQAVAREYVAYLERKRAARARRR